MQWGQVRAAQGKHALSVCSLCSHPAEGELPAGQERPVWTAPRVGAKSGDICVFLYGPARRRNRRGMIPTIRQSSTAQSQVQGGEPWRIFWAGAPPFSLVEKMGGAYTFPQPRLMFGRQTLISNEGQAQHRDDANLQRTLSPLSLAPTSQASSPQGEPFSGAMRVSFFLQRLASHHGGGPDRPLLPSAIHLQVAAPKALTERASFR